MTPTRRGRSQHPRLVTGAVIAHTLTGQSDRVACHPTGVRGERASPRRTRLLDRLVGPRLAHLARQVGVGLLVADERLLLRIPGQLAPQADGDHAQMTD